MSDRAQILMSARSVLLVDWPHPGVPRALLDAGLDVYGYSPGGYSKAELASDRPADVNPGSIFSPRDSGETGCLIFHGLPAPPIQVDLVYAYRPASEVARIVANQALPLGATALWLHALDDSGGARRIAAENGLAYLEGDDIEEEARKLRGRK